MKKIILLISVFTAIVYFSCNNTDSEEPGFVTGKNRFTLNVNGDTREYYVHVPAAYTGNAATPIVFMLHGTSGDGDKFYTQSGWKEVGETENILTVFPSSWQYCIFDEDGQQKNTTKWNSQPAEWTFCAGQIPRDDIKFLKDIITEMNNKFNIDNHRIYLAGFSNGGQMAARCAIEMSNQFAAIVENAGSLSRDSAYAPLRKMPVAYQVGNQDYGPGNEGPAIPLSYLDTLLNTPGLPIDKFYRIASAHIKSFELDPNFTISGDTNTAVIATYNSLSGNPNNTFLCVLAKGYGHIYPNGTNFPMEAAKLQYNWMKQYTLP